MFHRNDNRALFSTMLLVLALTVNAVPARALQDAREDIPPGLGDEIPPGVEMIPGSPVSYCHLKFPPIEEKTLGSDAPRLQPDSGGDMIDYYGPCDHDPLGPDEVQKQIREQQRENSREGSSD